MSKFLSMEGLLYFKGKILALLSKKVDTVAGKQLSSNDYTDADRTKLSGVAMNANNYSHPTGSGSNHVPAGGGAGSILRYGADGVAVWGEEVKTPLATASVDGLMPKGDKTKLDGIAASANAYTHPSYSARASGLYKVTVDALGHVTAVSDVAKDDITALGIPAQNTTYAAATSGAAGLMPAADKGKLDRFSEASAYALKTDIAGVYKYKGSKPTVAALPSAGNTLGDVWDVAADGCNYAWNGTAWDALGALFQVDAISNAEIDQVMAQ